VRWCLYRALSAFEAATRQDWTEAGAHAPEYYEQKAREALAWYRDYVPAARVELQKLESKVKNAEARLKVAESIRQLRKTELRRLVVLQEEGMVSAESVAEARNACELAEQEVEQRSANLRKASARWETLQSRLE
jgi:multidrug resistance efflux pump